MGSVGLGVQASAGGELTCPQWRSFAPTLIPINPTVNIENCKFPAGAPGRATAGGINEQVYIPVRRAGVFETVERSLDQISPVGAW
jgi:hypothetical protein